MPDTTRWAGRPIAIEIRCAGKGGRCGRIRALAVEAPPGSDALMIVTTEGTPRQELVLESIVRDDFAGVLDGFRCDQQGHDLFLVGTPTGSTTWSSTVFGGKTRSVRQRLHEGEKIVTGGVGMEAAQLRDAYEEYRRRGRAHTQTVRWAVGGPGTAEVPSIGAGTP
ncbi:hypothetical protein ABZX60_18700 [Streptomyces olivaceus]|uniref:hypothetical protein n=1 Tax=Streptomyces olivaceus TaxID=47716 RepID=UPI0018A8165E|nr:hypothetical protein [Streptomyces olivaceus]MBF8173347.1 hypothetical protein [Streptomyces olivaceus]